MSEQEPLSELDNRQSLTRIIIRMAREIAELKAYVATREGHDLPGCKQCRTFALIDGLQPAGPTEAIEYTCSECLQQYAIAPEAEAGV